MAVDGGLGVLAVWDYPHTSPQLYFSQTIPKYGHSLSPDPLPIGARPGGWVGGCLWHPHLITPNLTLAEVPNEKPVISKPRGSLFFFFFNTIGKVRQGEERRQGEGHFSGSKCWARTQQVPFQRGTLNKLHLA